MKTGTALLGMSLMVAFSSCTAFRPLTVKSVNCCDLRKSLRSDSEISFDIEIANPNDFPVGLKCYDLAIRINGNAVGRAHDGPLPEIPAHGSVSHTVTLTASAKQFIRGTLIMGLNALLKADPTTIDLSIDGSVVGKAKGFSKRVRFHKSYPVAGM